MKGLYHKYHITKVSGEPVDSDADYFVLRLDTDRVARTVVMIYAEVIASQKPQLAADLLARIERYMG